MKGLSGVLTPIQKSVFGAIERINKGKKAIYDSFRLILFEMLHGGGIFKNGEEGILGKGSCEKTYEE